MGYRAYPEYRESGVEWFGQCPAHWQRHRLKWTVESLKNGIWGSEPSGEDDLYCIRVADFDRVQLRTSPENLTLRSVEKKDRVDRLLKKGDLLLEKSGGGDKQLVGAVVEYTLNDPAVCSNFVAAMTTAVDIHSRYLAYLHAHLYSSKVNYRSIKQSTGIQNLDAQMYFDEPVIYPRHDEQKKIASFLDHKTAQIDRLIEKKQELIEKLQEQRIVTTTQAVTKGVVSGVAIKESNIQWFDSIPVHWQVIRLKDLVVDAIAGPYGSSLTKSMYTNNGYRVYGQQQVIPEDFAIGDYYISEEKYAEMQRYRTQPCDILISVMGTIGRAALVPDDAEPGIINPRLVLYRANENIVRPEYLKSFINSRPSQSYFSLVAQGTTMEGINMALIGELTVAVPPLHEQDEILLAQQAQTARLEKQIQSVANAITRLQEYRTALITAAVTGQIDIRDWQAPEVSEQSAQDKDVA